MASISRLDLMEMFSFDYFSCMSLYSSRKIVSGVIMQNNSDSLFLFHTQNNVSIDDIVYPNCPGCLA